MPVIRQIPRLFPVLCIACSAVPRTREAAAPATLEELAHLTADTWRLGFESGWRQIDRWTWGPGRYSMRGLTVSTNGDGETTSGVCRVVYWHPGRREIALLSLFSDDRLAEGTVAIGRDEVDFHYDFWEADIPRFRRPLLLRWKFDGPARYRSSLFEKPPGRSPVVLAEWDYERAATRVGALAETAPDSIASRRLATLRRLAGKVWRAVGSPIERTRSSVEWIPFADAIYVRVESANPTDASRHLFDVYVYHHPSADSVRILVLSADGRVCEGELTAATADMLSFDLGCFTGEGCARRAVRFDIESDGRVRQRIWSLGRRRELLSDTRHATAASPDLHPAPLSSRLRAMRVRRPR